MYCKECGNQIADDSKFCSSCGKLQNKEVTSKPENSNTSSLQSENKIADEKIEELKPVVTQKTESKNIFPDIENISGNVENGKTICPNCKSILNIPPEIINEDYIKCLGCNKTFHNPLKPEPSFLLKPLDPEGCSGCGCGCLPSFAFLTTPISIIICIVIFIIGLIIAESNNKSENDINKQSLKYACNLLKEMKKDSDKENLNNKALWELNDMISSMPNGKRQKFYSQLKQAEANGKCGKGIELE